MDNLSAYARMLEAKAAGNRRKVFDWNKAAELIRERKPNRVAAGLSGDWEYTGGPIYEDGKIVPKEDSHVYLCSIWATPEIELDGFTVDCWRYREGDDDWDETTYWPASAKAILES